MHNKHDEVPILDRDKELEIEFRKMWDRLGRCPEYLRDSHIYGILPFLRIYGIGEAYRIASSIGLMKGIDTDDNYFAVLMGRIIEYINNKQDVEN